MGLISTAITYSTQKEQNMGFNECHLCPLEKTEESWQKEGEQKEKRFKDRGGSIVVLVYLPHLALVYQKDLIFDAVHISCMILLITINS